MGLIVCKLKASALMTWFEESKFKIQIFTVFMVFLCPGFLIWMASQSKRQLASYEWPEAPGTVVGPVAKSWVDKEGNTKYFGRVAYNYEVKGKPYSSDLTDFAPGWKQADQETALADVSHYHPGQKVTVYYDPDDPTVGVLERGIPAYYQGLYVILLVASFVFLIGSVFAVRSWLRAWRARKTA
jgi:hypothetical protein